MFGDKVDGGHDEQGSEKIDGVFAFWGNGVGSNEAGLDEVNIFKFISRFEDNLAFGDFF